MGGRVAVLTNPAFFTLSVNAACGGLDGARWATLAQLLDAAGGWCVGQVAYLLATAWHECEFEARDLCADPAGLADAMMAGTITGKSLRQYILSGPGDAAAFLHCRKVVGAMDSAEQIAAIAVTFSASLVAGGWAQST